MDEMTEQERVMLAANALSAFRFVTESPARHEDWLTRMAPVSSGSIAALTGIPIEVVEAAVRNVGEEVTL